MKINRFFTNSSEENVLQTIFKTITIDLKNIENNALTPNKVPLTIEIPSHWSQVSINILLQNYFCKENIPTITKKIPEENIPEWLQRSEADLERLENLEPEKRYIKENSAKQVFHRIAGSLTYWGYKNNYFDNENEALIFFQEVQYILCHQIAAPSSQQWIYMGLNWAYGLKDDSAEYYYFDEQLQTVIKSKDYNRCQINSCFIQNVEDNLTDKDGVMDLINKEAKLFKHGSGSGSNFSKIRAKGEKLTNGGTSSGLMNFIRVSDTSAGAIKYGGTKRASKMVIVNLDHPDIEELINWKVKEEQKVVSLVTGSLVTHKNLQNILSACKNHEDKDTSLDIEINLQLKNAIAIAKGLMVPEKYIQRTLLLAKQGIYNLDFNVFSTGWDSESYYTVSGQNSNVALNVSNDFLDKVLQNQDWELKNIVDGSTNKIIPAQSLWDKISYAAWSCSDPSINFYDNINQWHTCPNDGIIDATNPYGEYLFLNDTSCSLASLNILAFRKENGSINIEAYKHVIKFLTIMLDISIGMGHFPSPNIAHLSYKFRPIGLGYTNMGSFLMSIGVGYDSEEGRNIAAALTALMTATSYQTSAQLAAKNGAFLGFENNKDSMLNVINNHRIATYGDSEESYQNLSITPIGLNTNVEKAQYLIKEAQEVWNKALELGKIYGYRNAQVSCISPTSTISLLMDCETTGIDPDFAIVKYKNIEGGGYFKIINPSVILGLKALGYSEEQIKNIENHAIGYKTLKDSPKINHENLKNKGFSDKEIAKIENSLHNIFNIEFAFNQYILGEDFCKNILNIDLEKLKNPNFSLLKTIGFSQEDINEANNYVTGTMSLENAPHLKPEHLTIFDCSMLCGNGHRILSYESHIKMLAAVQSFISGSISKTITMPEYTTIEDINKTFLLAWRLGIKIISLYREGSKLSQPLKNTIFNNDDLYKDFIEHIFNENTYNFIQKGEEEKSNNTISKISEYLRKKIQNI